jgi:photosystem II stability/assembly factor-like uncharacterized protein
MRKETKMKLLLLNIFILLVPTIVSSQWIPQNPGTTININAVDFINPDTGWAAGDSLKVYRTTTGGASWNTFTIPGNPVNLTHAVTKEIDKMFVGVKSTIYGTTNGGANWFQSNLGANYFLGDLLTQGENLFASAYLFNNTQDTIVSAVVFRSTNNGINWTPLTSIPMAHGDPIHGVDVKLGLHFINTDTAYLGTAKGVFKTVNGGLNFAPLPASPSSPRVVVAGSNSVSTSNTFFVGVDNGNDLEIFRSIDAGNTFSLVSSIPDPNDSKQFSDISCPPNTDKIFLTISNSTASENLTQDTSVYYSSNGGANWVYQSLPITDKQISSVDFINSNTGYLTGSGGTILKTTNGGTTVGIIPISNEVPGQYKLFQNYPNPFNPVTKIKFEILKSGIVSLKVYDFLGREVSQLVNENLAPGTYVSAFDAGKLSSGIYFYTLRTGDFTETKKMTLLK